jgi:hypothetical protein
MPPPASAIQAPTALLGLQDVAPTAADVRRRGLRRGRTLLDRLDEVRLGLLEGAVPLPALRRLRSELARTAEVDGDPRLRALLEAIDLRCTVELAKLEAAGAIV